MIILGDIWSPLDGESMGDLIPVPSIFMFANIGMYGTNKIQDIKCADFIDLEDGLGKP